MVERSPILDALTHLLLLAGLAAVGLPVYLAFVAGTLGLEEANTVPRPGVAGDQWLENLATVWQRADLGRQLVNSFVMAAGIAAGKIALSVLSAFALVYFRFPFRMAAFWAIFLSLMLPVEVRIVPTYDVMANVLSPLDAAVGAFGLELGVRWSMLNSYEGLILPLIASATATFLFRQVFLTVPDELAEAARIDGAGPLRFLVDVLLPLSRTNIAALGVILFVYGWNQYMWPLLVVTDRDMETVVVGITKLMPGMDAVPRWNEVMAAAFVAMLPPVAVVVVLQRWFVRGLMEQEK